MVTDEKLKSLRQPAPQQAPAWQSEPSTERQINYIKTLVEDRVVPDDWLNKIRDLTDRNAITKGKASEIISAIKPLPLREGREDRSKNQPSPDDVPAGRYAIQTGADENDLSFYIVRRQKERPNRVNVYRQAGPNRYWVRSTREANEILRRIYRAGAGEAAVRYGQKLGRCSTCGRELTKRISRELGIGPVCGGRFWDDWDARVDRARQTILARGEDPDENVEE